MICQNCKKEKTCKYKGYRLFCATYERKDKKNKKLLKKLLTF